MVNNNIKSCRICLSKTSVNGKSFDEDENLLQLFEFCSGISVSALVNKNAPRFVCEVCLADLEKYAKLKRKCVESELFWESFSTTDENPYKNNNFSNVDTPIKIEYVEFYPNQEPNNIKCTQNLRDNSGDSVEKTVKIESDDLNVLESSTNKNTDDKIGRNLKHDIHKKIQYKCFRPLLKKYTECKPKDGVQEYSNNTKTTDENNCGLCKVVCSNKDDLKKHLYYHWTQNILKCELCDYIGRDFADMVSHRITHKCEKNVKGGRQLRCFMCKTVRSDSMHLQFHFRQAHLNKNGGWCTSCGKTFKLFKTWRGHNKFHDNVDDLLSCDYCNRRFVFKYDLEQHIGTHLRIKKHICEICGNGFLKKSGLLYHISRVHSTNEPIKCEHCNKMYKNQHTLRIHMKEVTREKPHVCAICLKSFSIPSALKNHVFYHSGQQPFECDTCGVKFKSKSALTAHRLRRHMGVLKYKCLECEKGFFTSASYKRHLTVHTGVKKFKCAHCDKGFNAKNRLEAHLAKHKTN